MNDLIDVKAGLLETLRLPRPDGNGLTTEALAAAVSCDRALIVRAVNELAEHGYRIERTRDRWRLVSTPDIPFAFEFPGRRERIHYFPRISSTMDQARETARGGCADMTVIIAGAQTRGRGRMERIWASEDGGLYFTLIIKPQAHPAEAIKFNFLAALSLVTVLREECRIDARVKWPNDIMVDNGKLSGMLSEMDATGDVIHFINIGIGINVNNDPALVEPRAVSLRSLTGRVYSRTRILGLFLDRFEAGLQSEPDFADVITRWKKYAGSLNREVTVVTLKEKLTGFAEDVDDRGALILRLADGTTRTVCYGDCFYR
jgi:BirA family biotin operon repressor/biotin-[acetyl-CoA-carboxylase] ligase